MRLIDADALKIDYGFTWDDITPTHEEMYALIDRQPTIEPERKTGKWVNNIHDIPICNQCGYMTPYDRAVDDYEYGNYCPNCGADMRGVILNDIS